MVDHTRELRTNNTGDQILKVPCKRTFLENVQRVCRAALFLVLTQTGCAQFNAAQAYNDIAEAVSNVSVEAQKPGGENASNKNESMPVVMDNHASNTDLQLEAESEEVKIYESVQQLLKQLDQYIKNLWLIYGKLPDLWMLDDVAFAALCEEIQEIQNGIARIRQIVNDNKDSHHERLYYSLSLGTPVALKSEILEKCETWKEVRKVVNETQEIFRHLGSLSRSRLKNAIYGLLSTRLQEQYPYWQFSVAWETVMHPELKKLLHNTEGTEIIGVLHSHDAETERIYIRFTSPGIERGQIVLRRESPSESNGNKICKLWALTGASITLKNGNKQSIEEE